MRAITTTGSMIAKNRLPKPAFALPGPVNGIAKTPLPSNATVDTANTANFAQALNDQANFSGSLKANATAPPVVNIDAFSGIYRIINKNQPPVKIKVTAGTLNMQFLGDAGVPIPTDIVPQIENEVGNPDSVLTLYCPTDNRGPNSSFLGTYWEFWGLQKLNPIDHATDWAVGYRWSCYQLMRMVQANQNAGRMYDIYWQVGGSWEGGPSSDPYCWEGVAPEQRFIGATPEQIRALGGNPSRGVWQEWVWGASAIGANPPMANLQLHPADILRGYADHPLGLLISDCRAGSVWPAQRGDGTLGGSYPIVEGQWCRFAAGATMPNNLHPLGEVIWETARRYGFIINDKTNSCLVVRANPDIAGLLVAPGSSHDGRDWRLGNPLVNFPWSSLQLLAVGSDSDFHPTGT
jgi:hypothetical protein